MKCCSNVGPPLKKKQPTFGQIGFIFVSIKLIRKMPILTILPRSACMARCRFTSGSMEGQEVTRSTLEVLFFCVCLEDIIPKSLSISSVKPQVKFFIMEISEKSYLNSLFKRAQCTLLNNKVHINEYHPFLLCLQETQNQIYASTIFIIR